MIEMRRVTAGDAMTYGAIVVASWKAAYRGILSDDFLDRLEPADRAGYVLRSLESGSDDRIFLAYDGEKAVGALLVRPCGDADALDTGEVLVLYLLPEAWGKGHGKGMMDFAIEQVREMGFSTATLWVLNDNARGRRFYERYGFAPDGAEQDVVLDRPVRGMRYRLGL